MSDAPVHLGAYRQLIRSNRNFRLLWLAQIVSEIGDWLYTLAVFSLLLQMTGSAQAVALAFVMQVLPQTLVSPAAGVLNDRLSRKKVMIFADWARAVVTLTMLVAQTPDRIWLLYILLFAETVFWALFEPAHHAVVPNITGGGRETLVANALTASTWSFNLAIGSAVGGVLAALFGRNAVFVLNALTFVVSALLIRRMDFQEPHMAGMAPLRFRDLFDFSPVIEGFRYVRKDGRLLATMTVKGGLSLLGTNWVILPLLGERVFPMHVPGLRPESAGMLGMSLLMGARGVGALLGPLLISRWVRDDERHFRMAILAGFALASIGYFVLGLAPWLIVACLGVVVAHGGGSTTWVYSTTILQTRTADAFRGRVFSAEFALSMATLATVSYAAGVLADHGWAVRTIATMTGAMMLLPLIGWAAAQRLWRSRS